MAPNPPEPQFPDNHVILTHILVVSDLVAPYRWDFETWCFFRDPDGHRFEISQV